MSEADWYRLEVLVESSDADDASDFLWDIGAQGVEVQDKTTYMEDTDAPSLTPANSIPPVPEGKSRLIAFFEEVTAIPEQLDGRFDLISFEKYEDRSWETRWKEWFKPVQISRRLSVGPPWEEFEAPKGGFHVLIEPGMAFGTGTHDTTKLCAQAIDEALERRPGASLLDVGCGSAILAVMGSLLGAQNVIGIDNDPVAVEVAQANLTLNRTPSIRLSTQTLQELGTFDLVVANILAPILEELSADLIRAVRPGGTLIMSGVTTMQRESHEGFFEASELRHRDTRVSGDWICSVWERA